MDKFFVRFALQRSLGTFGETFPYESIMKAEDGEIEAFIEECDAWQKKQAEEISTLMDLKSLNGKRVLFVGDSITADRLGYRGIVTKAAGFESLNAAISGAVSSDMLRCIKDNAVSFKPEIVSVMLGTNDSLIIADEKNLVSLEEYENNLDVIIRICKESGASVIISTPPPTDEKRFAITYKSNNNYNIRRYCDVIRKLAKKHSVLLNDFSEIIKNEPLEEILEPDGIHLTSYGHRKFAEKWIETALTGDNNEILQ